MTTRREFIKKSAILAAGTLIIPDRFSINIKSTPRVIVLGAGLSGLSAAYALSKKDFKVTILEARNRIGGRVFSHKIDKEDNLIVELGGEWVGASHERIGELCKEFGLELQNNQFDTHLTYAGKYYPYSKWDYTPEWQTKYSSLIDGYSKLTESEKIELDKIDWWRYLMNNGIPERDLEIKELFDSTDFGESARHFSAFSA
ncbi:MAG: flavin monoamine oxidase family protein, partial [Ignavibacteria bacterium]